MIRIGINGFGRIGSLAFRAAIKSDDIEVVAINAPGHPASELAYSTKYDSVHGRYDGEVVGDDEASTLTVDGKVVKVFCDKSYRDASLVPWGEAGVEYVLECFGVLAVLVLMEYGVVELVTRHFPVLNGYRSQKAAR